MNTNEELNFLLKYLIEEHNDTIKIPENIEDKKRLFRSLSNIRPPNPISNEFLKIQDSYLTKENNTIINSENILPIKTNSKIALWKGDITQLKVDAIVNACNSQLLGCFIPLHNCIDNKIHSKAGIQLRLKCNEIIKKQGHFEENGDAKITSAYNLPSKYIIHTVGPQIKSKVQKQDKIDLKNCYISSLKKCEEYNIESIAFPCISTGVFSFPELEAAKIATKTVKKYLNKNPNTNLKKVIFNVFTENSNQIYRKILF